MEHDLVAPASGAVAGPATEAATTVEVLTRPEDLVGIRPGWDRLAEACSRPYCAPGWTVPWWEQARPPRSSLSVVAVRLAGELVGVAPLVVTRSRAGLRVGEVLAHTTSSYCEPLALPGHERAVAVAVAGALRGLDVLALAGIPRDSPWPGLLSAAWPGRRTPRVEVASSMDAPFVDLPEGGFDGWFAGRSRNFRQQARARRREFVARGGDFRTASSSEEIRARLGDLERLHLARWSDRGGSQALVAGIVPMLGQAADELGPRRMVLIDAVVDGMVVASALFVAAGDELHYWLGGFDEAWSDLSLSVLLLVEAVSHSGAAGCRRVSFGPGAQPYKYRLATGDEQLDWVELVPVGARLPLVWSARSPQLARRYASRRFTPETKERIRGVAERVRRSTMRALGQRR